MVEGIIILAVIIGVVLLTSLIKTVKMSDRAKNLIATVLSVVGGVVTDLSAKNFDVSQYQGVDILTAALVVYGGSQLIYKFIMKDTSLDAKLENVGSKEPVAEEPVNREGF